MSYEAASRAGCKCRALITKCHRNKDKIYGAKIKNKT